MSLLALPRRQVWTSQPDNAGIDWSNNGSLDFVFDGRATKSKSGRFQPEIVTGSPALSAAGILGRGIGLSGGAQRVKILDLAVCAGTEGFTLEILCSVTNVASLSGFMSTGHYGSGGNSRGLIAYGGAGKNIYFWGASSDLDSGVAWREDGSLQHVFCTSDGGSGTPMKFYRDGRLIASGTTPSIATTPASTMILGDSGQGWGASPTGIIFKAAFYRKALSAAEIKARTDYPWSTFKRPDSRIFVSASGSGTQTLTPSLFSHSQSFYSPTVSQSGGTQTLTPALYSISQTFYAPTVSASNALSPILFSNSATFFTAVLSASNTLTPSLYSNSSSLFAATITTSNAVSPSLYSNAQIFHAPTVSSSNALTASLFSNGQAFYIPTVSIDGGPQQLTADRVDNASIFYSPTLAPGAVGISPSIYANDQAFYSLTLTSSKTLTVDLFANSQAFYSPVVSLGEGPQVLSPALFDNTQSYFTQTVTPGAVSLFPVLLLNGQSFYSATVSDGLNIDEMYPLAGLSQSRPLAGLHQTYPLGN